ncbi:MULTISPECIES: hypothetical protein [unclassified Sphingobacterium]|uniref:hypothetical protein n=1 Tax=unclassified Sphingobacterium TaxID=2609468 RepID=UPI0020C36BCC|nr:MULTISPECIES: hypothetical protein [unclassified Sphingobacterium]
MLFKILFKYLSTFLMALIPYFHSFVKIEERKNEEVKTEASNSISMQHKKTRMEWHDSNQLINK